ncbi:MAG: hypothetical protein ACRDGN_15595 [bacterium]
MIPIWLAVLAGLWWVALRIEQVEKATRDSRIGHTGQADRRG